MQFEGLWKFHTIATLAERFSRASSNGEAIHWRVVDDYDKYSMGSSLWFFSSDANIYLESSKWNAVGGSKFSNNDGTWGLGNGRIDGSSRCGIQSEIFWGHENCGGMRDKNACNRYKLGTSADDPYLSSDNIRNEMFMGYPDTLPMTWM